MEYIVPAIILVVFIIQFLRKASKKAGETSNRSNASGGGFMNRISKAIEEARAEQAQRNTISAPSTYQRNSPPPPIPQLYREEDHFSEARLVEEFTRTHSQGKTIAHHTHDYFDPETDQSRSRLGEARRKRNLARRSLVNKTSIRQAMVLNAILERPDY